jgi:Polyketide cyclase / dehydrase and lipid transport
MKWALIVVGVLVTLVALVAVIGVMLPKNHLASRSSHFRQPPQAIWDAITGAPDWRPDIRSFEKLPPRDGHRAWKEIDKHGQAIAYVSVDENSPHRLVTRIADPKLPFGGTWTYEIVPESGGCQLTITEAGEIYNPIFRFMSRFVLGYSGSIETYLKALHAKFGEPAEGG